MRVAVAAVGDVTPHAVDVQAAAHLPAVRAREFAAARGLLRSLVAELGEGEIAARESGQPYLPDHPDLAVSLAHDGGYVAAACRRGRGLGVGVDVQLPVPASDGLLRRCGVAELAELPEGERDLEFAWVWTVQEACVKATGEGLSGRPWSIPVARGQASGTWRGVRWNRLRTSAVPVSVAFLEAP
ncbi:4'-phosphopantetheinyl transferase family protein [Lentzea chajnantorensis]